MIKGFKTASGAVYEIDGSGEEFLIRRVSPDHEKRGDGEWLRLIHCPNIEVGFRAVLVLESLADRGPDDHGTRREEAASTTTRVTTFVTEVW